jgi:hypothetical protein
LRAVNRDASVRRETALTGRSDALIHFLCVLPEHLRDPQLESDHITVVDGRWAFCAMNVRAEKHAWESTGGITRAEVANQLAQRRGQKT